MRDKGIIGQIHACPKCGSMVLIQAAPPEQEQTDDKQDQDAPLPETDFNEAAELLEAPAETPPTKAQRPPAEVAKQPTSTDDPPPDEGEPRDEVSDEPVDEPADNEPPRTADIADKEADSLADEPVDQDLEEEYQDEEALVEPQSQWKQMALMVGGVALGLVIAIACFVFFVARGGDNKVADNSQKKKSSDEGTDTKGEQHAKAKTKVNKQDATSKQKTSTKQDTKQSQVANKKVKQKKWSEKKKDDSGKGGSTKASKTKSKKAKKGKKGSVQAPIGFEPRGGTIDDKSLDPLVKELGNLLPNPLDDLDNEKGKKGKKKKKKAPPVLPPQSPSMVDARAQLTRRIPEIEFDKVALSVYLRFVADMTTIPITLDVDALADVGINSTTAISVNQKDATVAQLLTTAIKPFGLRWVLDDGHLIITRPNHLLKQKHLFSDLAKGDAPSKSLLSMITSLVEPKSWEGQGGKGKIEIVGEHFQIQNQAAVHAQVERLLSLMRQSRGQKKAGIVNPSEVVPAALAKKLSAPITANFLRQTNVMEIVDYIQTKSGVKLLIDWRSVYRDGLTPQTESKLSAISIGTGQAIRKLLTRYPVALRVIDDSTIQITSQRTLETSPRIGVYAVKDLIDKDLVGPRLVRRIRTSVGDEHLKHLKLVFDEAGKSLVVSSPLRTHTRVQELLARYRKEKRQQP